MKAARPRPSTTAALIAIGVTVLLIAGCSSSSPAQPDSSTGSHSSAKGASAASASPAAAHPLDVCAIVNAASAASLTGQPITTAVPRSGLEAKEYGCGYSNDDDSLQVQLTVFEHDASNTYDTVSSTSKSVSTVSGVGDKAFFDNDGTLYVLAGADLIQVNGLDTADQSAALARPVLGAL
ncbi:MAG: DUF3558 family protein [Jatrophihabitans sp.]